MLQDQSSQLPKTQSSWEEFEPLLPEKVEARKQLLTMPLKKPQKLVEQTLYFWQFHSANRAWEESTLTTYGSNS